MIALYIDFSSDFIYNSAIMNPNQNEQMSPPEGQNVEQVGPNEYVGANPDDGGVLINPRPIPANQEPAPEQSKSEVKTPETPAAPAPQDELNQPAPEIHVTTNEDGTQTIKDEAPVTTQVATVEQPKDIAQPAKNDADPTTTVGLGVLGVAAVGAAAFGALKLRRDRKNRS